jgi:hypothetical protein
LAESKIWFAMWLAQPVYTALARAGTLLIFPPSYPSFITILTLSR